MMWPIFLTIALTVCGQILIKWRVNKLGDPAQKQSILRKAILDPGILVGILAGFLAAMSWLIAMTRFPLSFAYPFTALNFVIVVLVSRFLFKERINSLRALGVGLIVLGTIFVSKG